MLVEKVMHNGDYFQHNFVVSRKQVELAEFRCDMGSTVQTGIDGADLEQDKLLCCERF